MFLQNKLILPLLFAITLFVSASLMFTLQPMAGKMMTPLFGGSPSTWLAAMVYFQISLLIGYGLAFGLSRFTLRTHTLVLCTLLFAGWFFLPLTISDGQDTVKSGLSASLDVLVILFGALSVPFIALSSLSPSLQRLFAGSKQDPYFLFAASNLGSFCGLFAYPFLFEKFFGLNEQTHIWQWGYGFLFILCITCWLIAEKIGIPTTQPASVASHKPVTSAKKAKWVLMAFVPSSLMMGITAQVTADTGAVPFFWVVPLGLYLLTFVLAFAKKQEKESCHKLAAYQAFSVILYILVPVFFGDLLTPALAPLINMLLAVLVFYISAQLFHNMLSASRPEPNYITQFYLWVACGGALGGLFNSFLAPVLFDSAIEFPFLAIFCAYIPLLIKEAHDIKPKSLSLKSTVVAAILVIALYFVPPEQTTLVNLLRAGLVLSLAFVSTQPWMSITALIIVLAVLGGSLGAQSKILEARRNFFGVMHVTDKTEGDRVIRRLVHGTTLHGMQLVKPTVDPAPTSYYLPVGTILNTNNAKKVGMIGLGAGATVCHTAPDRIYTIYEIDKDVVELASKWFSFMKECGQPKILIGDGRKLLEKENTRTFDALIVDAFSSDSIPVHLLTKEALELYMNRVNQDGIIALHISNRFYDLVPIVSAIADSLNMRGVTKKVIIDNAKHPLNTNSQWVVLAREESLLNKLKEEGWHPLPKTDQRIWTDDYSDMLSALKFNEPTEEENAKKN